MDTISVDVHVVIHPHEIGQPLGHMVRDKLRDTYVNKCVKKYGYILDMVECTHDKDMMISRVDETMVVKACAKLLVIMPCPGLRCYGVIKMVYEQGVFVSLYNIFDTLIPLDYLTRAGYVYDSASQSFVRATPFSVIACGVMVNARVTNTNYEQGKFNCIADIVD